jgi:uncharacterized Zn ribbon protein
MEYQNYKKGLCDKCDGNVQIDGGVYYCLDCKKHWSEDEWTRLVKKDKEMDYQYRDMDSNLSELNNMR